MTMIRETWAIAAILFTTCQFLQPTLAQQLFAQSPITQPVGSGEQSSALSVDAPGNVQTATFQKGAERLTVPLAMNGFCAVSIQDQRRWMKGSDQFTVLLDGVLYFFPSEQQKQTFLKNPTRYAPALRGDSVVHAVEERVRKPGSIEFTAIHQGRIFLFPDQSTKATFMQDPVKYADVDLAFGGKCVVSRVDQQQDVEGSTQFATIVNGIRFYFASDAHKKLFLKNPSKYISALTTEQSN